MLSKEKIEKIESMSKFLRSSWDGGLDNATLTITINADGKERFELKLESWNRNVTKFVSGSNLEECINELKGSMSTEIVELHNKLQGQLQFLKEAIDQIT